MIQEVEKPHEYLILAYHRVNRIRRDALTVDTGAFRRHLEFLLGAGYRNIDLEDLAGRVARGEPPRGRWFALTFDDGYRDSFTDALPVLRDVRCAATFFLAADFIGSEKPFPWDAAKFDRVEARDCPMDAAEVRELVAAGMSIGSHTCSHPLLATIELARARDEIVRSREVLEERFGVPVRTFCYPAGSLDDDVVACVAAAGYTAGVVTPRHAGVRQTMFTLKRVGVYQGTTPLRFRLRVHPVFARLRELAWR